MAIRTEQGDLTRLQNPKPMFFREMKLAHAWCRGSGIELGAAAHNPFGLPGAINAAPFSDRPGDVDYQDFLLYKNEQERLCGRYALVDLVCEAHALQVPDASQDYVISSHVVEHLPDLVSAFLEWNRVLKPGGVAFMVFPKRNALEADARRPITPLAEFIDDYNRKASIHTHPLEAGHGIRGHYHVFTLDSMLELIAWCNRNLDLRWTVERVEKTDSKVGNGHTVVARYRAPKRSGAAAILNRLRLRLNRHVNI